MTAYALHTPRGNPAHLEARDQTSDLSVIGSTFAGVAGSGLVDEYGLADLHITGRFVDVGAHVGSVAVAVLLDHTMSKEGVISALESYRDSSQPLKVRLPDSRTDTYAMVANVTNRRDIKPDGIEAIDLILHIWDVS